MTHRNFCTSILSVLFCAFFFITQSGATCYFPDYLQGEYVMQSSMHSSPQVQYSSVSVTEDVISIWGYCQKKIGNDLFLIENISNNSYCSRCFQISVKSKNILIVRTASNPHRCFLNASAAELSCPKTEHFDLNKQLILYKTNKEIKKEHCPFNGNYTLQYKQYKPNYTVECIDSSSYINNCPVGSDLNIYFRDCPFENYEIVYECLGTWNGPNNQKYLALFDTRSEETSRPQYRCGLYTEVSGNSTVYIAFSSDSTCTTDLKNSQSGFETFVLTSQTNAQLQVSEKNCRFPNWLQGHWELVTVDGKLLSYTDTVHFKTYIFYCLTYDESERRYEFPISADEDKKILVRGRSHCSEEEQYTCMWIKRRGPNVFEFQLSTENSFDYDSSLCLTANFKSDIWITQGRKDYLEESPCPVLGEYVGTLPGVENLCAKLSSDCAAPDTMYYTVSDCVEQIYEDREYKCLGQWQENGLTYTFTQRKYTGTYECFVGNVISESKFLIREAGTHCERNKNSLMPGMILEQKSSCIENRTSSTIGSFVPTTQSVPITVTSSKYTSKRLPPPTKSWRPILNTTRPQTPSRNKNSNPNNGVKHNVPSYLLLLFTCIYYEIFC
ncbi:hypothetical protein PGB90_009365 [Kerria lacca]